MTQKLTIIFDLDGTLADTAPDLLSAHNHVMKKFGYETKNIDEIRIRELEKAMNMIGDIEPDKKKIIDDLTKSVVENIVSVPMNNLRKETEQGNSELIDTVGKLFNYKKKDIST